MRSPLNDTRAKGLCSQDDDEVTGLNVRGLTEPPSNLNVINYRFTYFPEVAIAPLTVTERHEDKL